MSSETPFVKVRCLTCHARLAWFASAPDVNVRLTSPLTWADAAGPASVRVVGTLRTVVVNFAVSFGFERVRVVMISSRRYRHVG